MNVLDCIVIGYNDVPLARLADKHKPLKDYSGVYGELKTNSVLLGGARRDYMELLNHAIAKTHGLNPNLNAFAVPNLGAVYLTNYLRRRCCSAELVNFFNFEKQHLGQSARKMLVKGLDDREGDYHAEEAEIAKIFATWQRPERETAR